MSLNDLFGSFPGRPDHPDFAALADVVLREDGRTEDANFDFGAYLATIIDPDSLKHMATQRATRRLSRTNQAPPELVALVTAMYFDGFLAGYRFHERKTQTEPKDHT